MIRVNMLELMFYVCFVIFKGVDLFYGNVIFILLKIVVGYFFFKSEVKVEGGGKS